jgi:hypothetical protein
MKAQFKLTGLRTGYLCTCLGVALLWLALSSCGGDENGDTNQHGTLQFNATSYDVTEGTDGYVNIRVTRSDGSNGAASVDYATAAGSAEAGPDYTAVNGTLNWPNGVSGNRTISIAITDDNMAEGSEWFAVELSDVSLATLGANSSVIVNIIDDD